MFRICRMKEPTANLKQIIGWVHGDPHGGTNFGSFSGDLPSYHPGSLKWLDLHRFEVQRGDSSQARTKKGAGLGDRRWKTNRFSRQILAMDSEKSWVFIRFLFFFGKIRFQFPDWFFQMSQIVTRLPFKNPRYSDDLSSSMKLPDLRDRSIDAEWLFNVPAFLIVDPVVCEWNLTSLQFHLGDFNNVNTLR